MLKKETIKQQIPAIRSEAFECVPAVYSEGWYSSIGKHGASTTALPLVSLFDTDKGLVDRLVRRRSLEEDEPRASQYHSCEFEGGARVSCSIFRRVKATLRTKHPQS